MSSKPTVAQRIRQLLTDNNISQAQAGEALGLSQAAISRRLGGEVDFTITELATISELIHVPLASIITTTALAEGSAA